MPREGVGPSKDCKQEYDQFRYSPGGDRYQDLKAKHERVLQMLEVAKRQLEGCRGAMAYAYEDRCDRYYLNVAENIIETLAQIESLK